MHPVSLEQEQLPIGSPDNQPFHFQHCGVCRKLHIAIAVNLTSCCGTSICPDCFCPCVVGAPIESIRVAANHVIRTVLGVEPQKLKGPYAVTDTDDTVVESWGAWTGPVSEPLAGGCLALHLPQEVQDTHATTARGAIASKQVRAYTVGAVSALCLPLVIDSLSYALIMFS
jgi:hypothetical protein